MQFDAVHRLASAVSIEQEWLYLVNETLAGELCILPLLDDIANDTRLPSGLRDLLRRQIGEEQNHVERYRSVLNGHACASTGYVHEFSEFVRSLPSATLRLFSLQSILESISLAAIAYRQKTFRVSPSSADDLQIYRDEQGHVRFGLGFIEPLQHLEGVVPVQEFHRVARTANGIFAKYFNGNAIAHYMDARHGLHVEAAPIDASEGMRVFRRLSAQTIVEIKSEFLSRYHHKKTQANTMENTSA